MLLEEQVNRTRIRGLAGACGLCTDFCGSPKLSRDNADDPLDVEKVRPTSGKSKASQAKAANAKSTI